MGQRVPLALQDHCVAVFLGTMVRFADRVSPLLLILTLALLFIVLYPTAFQILLPF